MLEENGKLLRVTREAAGLTYQQVEDATKVRELYLKLLENGDMSGMPGRIYAIGFAETYARYLGIDPQPLVQDVKDYYAANATEGDMTAFVSGKRIVQTAAEGEQMSEALQEMKIRAESRLSDRNSKAEHANRLRASAYVKGSMGRPIHTRNKRFGGRFLWLVLGSIIVVLLTALFLLQGGEEQPNIPPDDVDRPPVTDQQEPIQLVITAIDEEVWVGLVLDDEERTQSMIPAGSSMTYTAQEQMYVRYNKATHVSLEYNGTVLTDFSGGYDIWNMEFGPDTYRGYADEAAPVGYTSGDTGTVQ